MSQVLIAPSCLSRIGAIGFTVAVVSSTACGRQDGKAVPEPIASAPPSAGPSIGAPASSASTTAATPDQPGWKLAEPAGEARSYRSIRFGDGFAFKPLKDSCTTPTVKLADSPNQEWNWIRQAMIANPEFREVADPKQPLQVAFFHGVGDGGYELYARCADAKTCNDLAGMYTQVVWASFPRPRCSGVPDKMEPVTLTDDDGLDVSPEATKHLPLCARLNACATRVDPKDTRVGAECQKAWTKFPLHCARKPTCAEVAACMKAAGGGG